MTISGEISVKKGQKILKKATILIYIWFFRNFFALANLIHINSYNMKKKLRCHYISFGVIFSHLVKLRHHFQIYYQQLSTTSNDEKWIFFTNKSLGTVHMHAGYRRKKLILHSKISKNFKKIDTKLPLLVPKTF